MYGYTVIETESTTYYTHQDPVECFDYCEHCQQMSELLHVCDEELNMVTVCQECANTLMRAGG